jgi:ketosteroid isomerase-like protein
MADERQAFLDAVLPVFAVAERAMHSGDPEPRKAEWSRQEPVTLLGAGVRWRCGWDEIAPVQVDVAARFAACLEEQVELLAAGVSGDLGYTVIIGRSRARRPSGEELVNELRLTHVYRREDGEWKMVHRHGDHLPDVDALYDTRTSGASTSRS